MNSKILFLALILITWNSIAQSPVTLLEPVNGAKNVRLFPAFKWTRGSYTGGYEFQISIKSDFSVASTHSGALANPHISPCTLLPSTQYFWRVRQREGQVIGDWSSEFMFITRDTIINLITEPLQPVNHSEQNVLNPINFKWKKTAACQYALQLSKDKSFPLSGSVSFLTGSDPRYTHVPKLELNTTYYWRVCSVFPSGPWSEIYSFNITASAPAPPPEPPPVTPPVTPPPVPQPPPQPAVRLGLLTTPVNPAFSFPNPFIGLVTITFQLETPGLVEFEISDSQGIKIDRFKKSFSEKGQQSVEWHAKTTKPGNYFCKIVTGQKIEIVKLLLSQ